MISRMGPEELAGAKAQLWKRQNEISVEMDEIEEMLGLVNEREGDAGSKAPQEGAG